MTAAQRFHSRCGKNICLSDNNTVARRVGDLHDSVVFTEQPVPLGTVFQVKLLKHESYRPETRFNTSKKRNGSIVSVLTGIVITDCGHVK